MKDQNEAQNIPDVQKSVPEIIGIVDATTGGKNYDKDLKEYVCLTYGSLEFSHDHSILKSGDKSFQSTRQCIWINPNLQSRRKPSKRTGISVLVTKESNIDADLFRKLLNLGNGKGEDMQSLTLKEVHEILTAGKVERKILFVFSEEDTFTLAGSEDVLHVVRKYVEEPEDDRKVLTKCESGPFESNNGPEDNRQLLAKAVARSVLHKTGCQTSSIQGILEECLRNNLKQCEEWTVSLLTDLVTVNSSEQYIKDINDHVIDYLTQSFRQKHSMLAVQDTTECHTTPVRTTSHVAVLQKLSPTLYREIKLEGTSILDYMIEQDALSDTDRQSILAHPTEKRKNEAFIDHLCGKYSMSQFRSVVLPILRKDEHHQRIAAAIEEELQKEDLPKETNCTFCRMKDLVDLRALSEPLLACNSISQSLRRDLCCPTIPSRCKWEELLSHVEEESLLSALKAKYSHFYEEFQTTGHSPMKCSCADDDVELREVFDVAVMDDLLSEIGSRISFGLQNSSLYRAGSRSSTSQVKVECMAGYRKICGICQQMIRDTRKLNCGHVFCKVCIGSVYRLVKRCPVCGSTFESIKGTMPSGSMTNTVEKESLPGFPGFGTIVISYRIEDGIQTDEHPCPGERYRGITCSAYLPNSLDGQLVLLLLQTAWDRCLTFTLRQSVTSSMQYVLSWNGISHKTNRTGGPQNHGYPDEEYLSRIKREFAEHGILAEGLRSTMV